MLVRLGPGRNGKYLGFIPPSALNDDGSLDGKFPHTPSFSQGLYGIRLPAGEIEVLQMEEADKQALDAENQAGLGRTLKAGSVVLAHFPYDLNPSYYHSIVSYNPSLLRYSMVNAPVLVDPITVSANGLSLQLGVFKDLEIDKLPYVFEVYMIKGE